MIDRTPAGADGTDNEALWLRSRFSRVSTGSAPVRMPGPHEILVRNRAVALNPIDVVPSAARPFILPWLRYPAVLGTDVAGEIAEVGSDVTRFRNGDRVLGHALGIEKSHNDPAQGAFQRYTILQEHMASPAPGDLPLEDAATLPLTLSTAACGLLEPDLLGLRPPRSEHDTPDATESVVVGGASTNVGGNAVHLARNAGYHVIAITSSRSANRVRSLGGPTVIDHRDASAANEALQLLRGRTLAGVLAIGSGSVAAAIEIAHHAAGPRRVAAASIGPAVARFRPRARNKGIVLESIWGDSLATNAIGAAIYRDYLPHALESGKHVPRYLLSSPTIRQDSKGSLARGPRHD